MYATAREMFEAAREAALDAERIGRELAAMEGRSESLGFGGFQPRVRSTPEPDRMAGRVAAMVDRSDMLARRMDEDYRLIDAACEVLYGKDGRVTDAACRVLYGPDRRSGLYALVGWPADAIYHHYLGLRTWEQVADMLGYSVQHVRRQAMAALDLADANGQMWTEQGRGMAT